MLKFIRKYQMIILVVGGSLLVPQLKRIHDGILSLFCLVILIGFFPNREKQQ